MLEENTQESTGTVILVLAQGYIIQMTPDKSKIISAL